MIRILEMHSPCYCKNLRDFTRKMTAIYDAELAAYDINITQYSLLRLIVNNNPVSLTQLGDIADLDRSTVGRNVTVMVRQGWLKVDRDDMDKRQQLVFITSEGEALVREAFPAWQKCQQIIEERIGTEKIGILHNLLQQL